jgi:hypothetical protein
MYNYTFDNLKNHGIVHITRLSDNQVVAECQIWESPDFPATEINRIKFLDRRSVNNFIRNHEGIIPCDEILERFGLPIGKEEHQEECHEHHQQN